MTEHNGQNGIPGSGEGRNTEVNVSAPTENGQAAPLSVTGAQLPDLDLKKIPDSISSEYFSVEQDTSDAPEAGASVDLVESPMSVDAMVHNIKGIVLGAVSKGLEDIGIFLLVNVFDNDFRKVFSKNPYKDTSFSELAKHPDMPLSRQRLSECVRAAAFSREMEENGQDASRLRFSLKIELGKIKDAKERMETAEHAIAQGWTFQQTRKEVQKVMGKKVSEDTRLGRTVLRQVGELVRLSTDKDAKGLLDDKVRLKAAMKRADRLALLAQTEEAREHINESDQMLKRLEKTLVDIEIEDREAEEQESSEQAPDSDTTADE